jgi:hypothetical protein
MTAEHGFFVILKSAIGRSRLREENIPVPEITIPSNPFGGYDMNNAEAVALARAKQSGLPYASKENKILMMEPQQQLDKLIPEEFARTNNTLPLFRDGNTLGVAIEDPADAKLLLELRRKSGLRIQAFVASRFQIMRAIDEFYV